MTTNNAKPAGHVIGRTFEVSRAVDKDGNKLDTTSMSVQFDFTGVSHSALMDEAMRNIIVRYAGKVRGATERKDKPLSWKASVAEHNNKVIKVLEFLASSRNRKTPQERAAKLAETAKSQDPETVKRLIAELQKQLVAKK